MEKEHKKIEKKYPEPVVGSLIINKEGKILLAKSKKWNKKYTIFGGHVEHKETLEDAVIRESKEEAGIDVAIVDKLGFDQSISAKDHYEDRHFVFMDFLCRFDGNNEEIKMNEEYENDFKWFSIEEALKLDLPHGTRRIIEAFREYRSREDYLNSWKRCVADFENYKKRQNDNQKEIVFFANMNLIQEILPVLDNFYASTGHIPEDQKNNAWVTGIMHIQRQLNQVLADNGVEEIETKIGDDFNPSFHEAILPAKDDKKQASGDKKEEGKIEKVVQRGYKIGDKIIRPVKVVVI